MVLLEVAVWYSLHLTSSWIGYNNFGLNEFRLLVLSSVITEVIIVMNMTIISIGRSVWLMSLESL